jgi:hypothetical protein
VNDWPIRFVIPGKRAYGYVTTNRPRKGERRKVSKQAAAYWNYCGVLRMIARSSGIRTPMESPPDAPLMVFTRCYFYSKTHLDPENVHKGVKDALCYGATHGDKFTGGHYLPPMYDKVDPRVEVLIRPKRESDEDEWVS